MSAKAGYIQKENPRGSQDDIQILGGSFPEGIYIKSDFIIYLENLWYAE